MMPEDLEKRLEEAVAKLEKRAEELGKNLEERFTQGKNDFSSCRPRMRRGTPFWGIALVVVGFLLLANHMHWFLRDLPIIPIVLIALGALLLFDRD
jgi:hypothetical protein